MKVPVRHKIQSDETLLSWVARLSRTGAPLRENDIINDLLGRRRARLHPYLPSYISKLASAIHISEWELLNNHTLYQFFRFFGLDTLGTLRDSMLSGDATNTVIFAGLPHTKISFFDGHKYCPICVRLGRYEYGFGYFKIHHQIPGVEACSEHGCELVGLMGGNLGYDRHLVLPSCNDRMILATTKQIEFADFANKIWQITQHAEEPVDYHWVYRSVLSSRGFITQEHHLRLAPMLQEMNAYYEGYSFGRTLGLPISLQSFEFIGPLLRNKTHYPCHPTKHLLFAFWLFDGDASLYASKPSVEPLEEPQIKTNLEQTAHVLSLLKEGMSMNQIETVTGKSRSYIRRVAELNHIPHQSHATKYPQGLRQLVVLRAKLGQHRQKIADLLGVGLGYVEQIISSTKGLVPWRKALRVEERVYLATEVLKRTREQHPDWLRKDIKAAYSVEFFCLYHHDRALLELLLPPKTKPVPPGKDWGKEDARLVSSIQALAQVETLSLSQIDHAITGHGLLRKSIDKLPMTRNLLIKLGKFKLKAE
ncbi:TnsD family Tn7-like transposition protein [Shewanella atlantica]|uniref:Uncharacterized protein n=1 Tax=Shewanella atlantica TaxID=271099 RepID=A0A3S0I7J6_9GAMM|nr:TnsD family Tn7-like transposition protein [Shewanella atlantica]RTR27014.1 hypothetical protein EKG39_21115 [Shewanella atlantica]